MCGIILEMSNDKLVRRLDRNKAITQGIIMDTLRGHHSTGLAYINYDAEASIYKKPMPGHDFIEMPKYKEIINDSEKYPFLLAHNRWATKGKVNIGNAHPFQHDHITGVHNGSLDSWLALAPGMHFDTDSEHIIHALANRGVEETLAMIDGAAALAWHDATDNTMHIIRNDERPFHFVHVAGMETVFGGSELEMLDLMCVRNHLKISDRYSIEPKNEFIFSLDDINNPTIIEREMQDATYNYNAWPMQHGANKNSNYLPATVKKEIRECVFIGFHKYSSKSCHGYIEGAYVDSPFTPVRVNGVKVLDWEKLSDKQDTGAIYFKGIVVGDGKDLVTKEVFDTMQLESLTWIEESDIFEEDDDKEEDKADTSPKFYKKQGENNIRFTKDLAMHMLDGGCGICGDHIPIEDFEFIEWWNDSPLCLNCDIQTAEHLMAGG
jgi:predicted glutamine amidotransferase